MDFAPHLLLDLVCNRALNAMVPQAITYYNVLAGRVGTLGMTTPPSVSAEVPFLQAHNEQMPVRRELIQQMGGQGVIVMPNNSRFAGNMVQAEDGNWRKVEPFTMTPDGTAIIHVMGALVNRGAYVGSSSGVTSYEGVSFSLNRAANDKRVRTILLDIASPGGESAGNDEIAKQILAIRQIKPVLGVANALAASAGYAILSACTEAYGTASSLVGSIGCIMLHLDKTEQAKNEGVVPTIIYAGNHKADGHAYQSLTPDALAELKAGVNSYYELFAKTVGAGRGPKLTAKMARDTEARTFVGREAKTAGLLDDLATFEQVLSAADQDNRKRARRASPSKEGTSSMSTLVAQMLGGAAPVEATIPQPNAAAGGEPIFQNGQWYQPMPAAGAPVAPAAPAAPAAPTAAVDPRIAAAMASPILAAYPQLNPTVLGYLRTNPAMSADQAIAAALPHATAPSAPAAPYVPPHYAAAAPLVLAAPAAPVQHLPPAPAGYQYAQSADGQFHIVAANPQTPGHVPPNPVQALQARVNATGVGGVAAAAPGSPAGVPHLGQHASQAAHPQQPRADGYMPGDVPGSVTLAMAPWGKHVDAANQRAAGFQGIHAPRPYQETTPAAPAA